MKAFETVSFHIVKPCNMNCKFCYATFDDMRVGPQMSLHDACVIVNKLAKAGVQKITFAGSEPMLYKYLQQVICEAKALGLTTSIITNGSLLTDKWLNDMMNWLDWVGVSIDSLNRNTQYQIGRIAHKEIDYSKLVESIRNCGYKLKINTVVNAYNWQEDMNSFIDWASPYRWKVFQALRVEGQNDNQFDEIKVTEEQYQSFLNRHQHPALVPEDNEAMTGSYLLIDPLGRLFENSAGKHTYSDTLITNNIDHCLSQINLDRDMFIKRGGAYAW